MFSFGSLGSIITMGGMHVQAANLGAMRLGAGSTASVNGQTIAGPCVVEVRQGVIYKDGAPYQPDGKPVSVTTLEINIAGDHEGPIDIGGGSVSIQGSAHGSISTGSGTVHVVGSLHDGGISTGSGSPTVEGDVAGSVRTGSGSVMVYGSVAGSVSSMSGRVQTGGAGAQRRTTHRHRVTPLKVEEITD